MSQGASRQRRQAQVLIGLLLVLAVVGGKQLLGGSASPDAAQGGTPPAAAAGEAVATPAAPAAEVVMVAWAPQAGRDLFDPRLLLPEPAPADRTGASPQVQRPAEPVDPQKIHSEAVRLLRPQGTMNSDPPRAIINRQIVRVGDSVEGFTIEAIASRHIVVAKDGIEVRLDLEN